MLEPFELARKVVDLVSDVKGENIVLLDMQEVTPIADYFVICSGSSERQLKAIVQKVSEGLKQEGYRIPPQVEGDASGGWILVDYNAVVLHVFLPEQRDYYDLEDLWSSARTLLRMQ